MSQAERVEKIRRVVGNWDERMLAEGRRIEGVIADAAADALADAMLDHDDFTEALADGSLTSAEDELRAVHTMDAEVNDGGFLEFFDNCGREEVVLAAQGCARIGAPHFETLVKAALLLVPVVPEEEWPEELEAKLNLLDETFFDTYRELEELLKLRLAYMADHPEKFRGMRRK